MYIKVTFSPKSKSKETWTIAAPADKDISYLHSCGGCELALGDNPPNQHSCTSPFERKPSLLIPND